MSAPIPNADTEAILTSSGGLQEVYEPAGGGGSTGGSVTVTNFPATQPVSGSVAVDGVATAASQNTQTTVLNTISTVLNELNTDFGMPSEAAWSGTGNGTVIAILKALHAQNVQMIGLLTQIESNTATV